MKKKMIKIPLTPPPCPVKSSLLTGFSLFLQFLSEEKFEFSSRVFILPLQYPYPFLTASIYACILFALARLMCEVICA